MRDFLAPEDRRAIEAEIEAFPPLAPFDLAAEEFDRTTGLVLLDGRQRVIRFPNECMLWK